MCHVRESMCPPWIRVRIIKLIKVTVRAKVVCLFILSCFCERLIEWFGVICRQWFAFCFRKTAMIQCRQSHWLWDFYFHFRIWIIPFIAHYYLIWSAITITLLVLMFKYYLLLFSFFFLHDYSYRHWISWIRTVLIHVSAWRLIVSTFFDGSQSCHGWT